MDERTARLLLKGIRTLPEREQNRVLTELLCAAIVSPGPHGRLVPGPAAMGELAIFPDPTQPPVVPQAAPAGRSSMLPIRLPPDLHERLREWSTDHGFSMAGVVRGLVERFLEEQRGRGVARPPAESSKRRAKRPSAGG